MKQVWNDLLFAHWKVNAAQLEDKLPEGMVLDTWREEAYVGVVPFAMDHVRGRWIPPIPFASSLLELNVRTYVTYKGVPGVYFFSLDANHRLAVQTARRFFHLPYYFSKISIRREGKGVFFSSERQSDSVGTFSASYEPVGTPFVSAPDSLEYWLTERYCLFTSHKEKIYRGDIHHLPWNLQKADATFIDNRVALTHSIYLPDHDPILHYSTNQEVIFWKLTPF
ncbi:YqjF family protein [Alteribacter aurantiacus]|uniref:YqjF family protein n=1 Tax=Alteribacter aurantiacus TaxID=254410 RepID=UPI001FE12008|nr:DUF2071 domain-containing protein [Alteribacter aurantiacus]